MIYYLDKAVKTDPDMFFINRTAAIAKPKKKEEVKARVPTPPPDEQDLSQFLKAKRDNKPVGKEWEKKAKGKERGKKKFKKLVNKTITIGRLKKLAEMDNASIKTEMLSESMSRNSSRRGSILTNTFSEEEWKSLRSDARLNYIQEREEIMSQRDKKWLETEGQRIKEAELQNSFKKDLREKYLKEVVKKNLDEKPVKHKKKVIGWTEKNRLKHEKLVLESDSIFGEQDLFFTSLLSSDFRSFKDLGQEGLSSTEKWIFPGDKQHVERSETPVKSEPKASPAKNNHELLNEKLESESIKEESDAPNLAMEESQAIEQFSKDEENPSAENHEVNFPKPKEEPFIQNALVQESHESLPAIQLLVDEPSTSTSPVPPDVPPLSLPENSLSAPKERSRPRAVTPISSAAHGRLRPGMKEDTLSNTRLSPNPRAMRGSKSPLPSPRSPRANFKPAVSPRSSPRKSNNLVPGERNGPKPGLSPSPSPRKAKLSLTTPREGVSSSKSPQPSPRRVQRSQNNSKINPAPQPSPRKSLNPSLGTRNNQITVSPRPSPRKTSTNTLNPGGPSKTATSPRPSPRKIPSLTAPSSIPGVSNDRREKMKERRIEFENRKKEAEKAKLPPPRQAVKKRVGFKGSSKLDDNKKVGDFLGWANGGTGQPVEKILQKELL